MVCISLGISTALFTVIFKNTIDRELLTVCLQIVTDVVLFFGIAIRMVAELQNLMTAPQRIYQYCQLESEDDLVKPNDDTLAK